MKATEIEHLTLLLISIAFTGKTTKKLFGV